MQRWENAETHRHIGAAYIWYRTTWVHGVGTERLAVMTPNFTQASDVKGRTRQGREGAFKEI
jgi:hypothetical protein